MSLARSLGLHLLALVVGTGTAFSIWTRDEAALQPSKGEVAIWGGGGNVTRVSFKGQKRSVAIEPQKDAVGPWVVVDIEKEKAAKPVRPGADAHPPDDAPKLPGATDDAGAPPDAKAAGTPPVPEIEHQRFVGVKAAEKFFSLLSPLKAARSVGRVDDARKAEFGLDASEGTLKIAYGATEHSLELGGSAPGGEFRYVRDPASGEVFAVASDLAQFVLHSETWLLERELHGFADEDVTRVRILKADKSRELVPVKGKVEGWADAANPEVLDETAGNWISKIGRVSLTEYVEKPQADLRPEDLIVRVEYFAGTKNLGFMELSKPASAAPGKTYLARTEFTRWHAQVLSSAAEQLEQDLESLLK